MGGGIGMGNTCKPMAVLFQCMTKFTTKKKKKEPTCQCGRPGFHPCVGKVPGRRAWQPTAVLLPGKSLGQRSLAGYSPWGHKKSDATEHVHVLEHTHTHTHTHTYHQSLPSGCEVVARCDVNLHFPDDATPSFDQKYYYPT